MQIKVKYYYIVCARILTYLYPTMYIPISLVLSGLGAIDLSRRKFKYSSFILGFAAVFYYFLNGFSSVYEYGHSVYDYLGIVPRYFIFIYIVFFYRLYISEYKKFFKLFSYLYMLLAIASVLFPQYDINSRLIGVFQNANLLGFISILSLVFVHLSVKSKLFKLIYFFFVAVIIYLTGSLSASISLIVYVFFITLNYPKTLIFLLVSSIFLLPQIVDGAIFQKLLNAYYILIFIVNEKDPTEVFNGSSALWRLFLWYKLFQVTDLFGLVFGNGFGAAWFVFRENSIHSNVFQAPNTHSDLVTLIFEIGAPMTLLFILYSLRLFVTRGTLWIFFVISPFYLFDNFVMSSLNYPVLMLLYCSIHKFQKSYG